MRCVMAGGTREHTPRLVMLRCIMLHGELLINAGNNSEILVMLHLQSLQLSHCTSLAHRTAVDEQRTPPRGCLLDGRQIGATRYFQVSMLRSGIMLSMCPCPCGALPPASKFVPPATGLFHAARQAIRKVRREKSCVARRSAVSRAG